MYAFSKFYLNIIEGSMAAAGAPVCCASAVGESLRLDTKDAKAFAVLRNDGFMIIMRACL